MNNFGGRICLELVMERLSMQFTKTYVMVEIKHLSSVLHMGLLSLFLPEMSLTF